MNHAQTFLSGVTAATLTFAFASEALATEWNVSLWGKRRAFTEHVEKLAELVSEKTGGEFTLNISYGGLSKNKENLDGISIGAFEMAQFCAGYHRDKNRTITVLELPFLGVSNLDEEVAVSHAVYGHPAVQDELAQWNAKLLMTSPMPQYNIVGTGDPRDESGRLSKACGCAPPAVLARPSRRWRCADIGDRDRGLSGDGIGHRGYGGLCPARASEFWHDQPGRLVDRQPEPRHGELPGCGEYRRL